VPRNQCHRAGPLLFYLLSRVETLDLHRRGAQAELAGALRCVMYDALVLADALARLQRNRRTGRTPGLPQDQPAMESAFTKSRSLYDFLTRAATTQDDILIAHFGKRPLDER